MELPYRPCVGVMLINNENKVFVARRIKGDKYAWQMPQGGIDKGEKPLEAAMRELLEEIGTNNIEILASVEEWLSYDLPDELIGKIWKGKYRGQKQRWFLARFLGEDEDININTPHPEFCQWRWGEPHELPDLIVPFKKQLYKDILQEFSDYL